MQEQQKQDMEIWKVGELERWELGNAKYFIS